MKLKNRGLKPYYVKSRKDYSFHRTFGSIQSFVSELNLDKKLGDDFQGNTNDCTAYSISGIGSNQDGVLYSPDYQMMKTYELMNVDTFDGADLKNALNVPVSVGYLPNDVSPISWQSKGQIFATNPMNWPTDLDNISSKHRRQAYFILEKTDGMDWFDSIRSAITLNNTSIALATPWYLEYGRVQEDGILPIGTTIESWHSTEITGWKLIQGITYLICKSHQGNVGDNGYVYFSRDEINRLMDVLGSCGGVISKNISTNIFTIQLSIMEQLIGWFKEAIYRLTNNTKPSIQSVQPTLLYPNATVKNFCLAIASYEGNKPQDRSIRNCNPGNLRFRQGMELVIGKDKDNFAIFKSYEDGFKCLTDKMVSAIQGNSSVYSPMDTILTFFQKYSPVFDNNKPNLYAEYVAKKIGTNINFTIGRLIV